MKKLNLVLVISLALILALISLLGACTTPSEQEEEEEEGPGYGGTLKIGSTYEPTNLGYPPEQLAGPDSFISCPAVETLLRLNKDGSSSPFLAEDYEFDTAAKTLTLSLKKGVKFHDGTDFNAAAVKYNLDLVIASELYLQSVESIDAVDDSTVRLNFASDVTPGTIGELSYIGIISPTAFQENGKEWCIKNPVGTGPFVLDSWQSGVKVVFERFDDYWQEGKPYLDGIEWHIITNPMTARASFLAGEIDVYHQATLDDVSAIMSAGQYGLYSMPVALIGFCGDSGNQGSPFADVNVRRAMTYAVDSQAISDAISNGNFKVSNQLIAQGNWGYNPAVEGYPYNPAKAVELLAEAGYNVSNPLETTLTFPGVSYYPDIYAAVQGQLQEVGIDVTLDPAPPPRFMPLTGPQGFTDLLMAGFGPVDAPSNFYQMLSSQGSSMVSVMHPADLDEVIFEAWFETDTTVQQQLIWEAQRLAVDEYCLATILFTVEGFATYNLKVHDSEINNITISHYTPENAWIEQE